MWEICGACNDLIFEREKKLPLLCSLFSYELSSYDFDPYYSVRVQGRLFVWQAKHWRSSPYIFFAKHRWRSNNRLCFRFLHAICVSCQIMWINMWSSWGFFVELSCVGLQRPDYYPCSKLWSPSTTINQPYKFWSEKKLTFRLEKQDMQQPVQIN
jgi:hypothetical protein